MNNSKNSVNISLDAVLQLPLKGFRVKSNAKVVGREVWLEGMGDGRLRAHVNVKRLK